MPFGPVTVSQGVRLRCQRRMRVEVEGQTRDARRSYLSRCTEISVLTPSTFILYPTPLL